MKDDNKIDLLNKKINKLNELLIRSNIIELSSIVSNNKSFFLRNFLSGLYRGIGIGIGVTIVSALIVSVLQKIVTLNIPVIGEFVIDIVDIVNKSKY